MALCPMAEGEALFSFATIHPTEVYARVGGRVPNQTQIRHSQRASVAIVSFHIFHMLDLFDLYLTGA